MHSWKPPAIRGRICAAVIQDERATARVPTGSPHDEVRRAWPYRDLDWSTFERVIDFVATGGYALRAYERYAKLRKTPEGLWRIANPQVAQQYRLNVGTIIEEPMVKVRLVKGRAPQQRESGTTGPIGRFGRVLGEMEEYFFGTLSLGDTFMFGGEIVAFEGMKDNEAFVSRAFASNPKIPSYMGGKFPLSTYLAERVRRIMDTPGDWHKLPDQVSDWLERSWRACAPKRLTRLMDMADEF